MMYLKSIEVQGFKSFANKILFEFHNGITAIVGPNGSGKSNVADAVRWVLGEQSAKQLRGAKMEDIIFSGTENRKALGFAYVALTIDNTDHELAIDFDEVKVARRVYRSGESEYLLNGTPCRLKDVNELFYDTGIGKEGYSIIGQGQIDKILSGKPEERRELFDEAAGIVKFKRRKQESIRKLEAEKQNLTRVEDILSELEKQVGPLARQAEAAKEYLKYKEELKLCDITLFILENASIKEQLKEAERKADLVSQDLEASKTQYEIVGESYHQMEEQLSKNKAVSEETQAELTNAMMTKEKSEGEINLLKEQIHSAQTQEDHQKERCKAIFEDLEVKKQEIGKYQNEKEAIETALIEVTRSQEAASHTLTEITNKRKEVMLKAEEGRNRLIFLLNEKSGSKANMQRYETMFSQTQLRKAELARKLIQHKSMEAIKNDSLNEFEEEWNSVVKKIGEKENESKNLSELIHQKKEEVVVKEAKKNQITQEFHRETSRLESLKNMTERYDGYGNSIRKIMDLKSYMTGIIGVVADIIKADKKYETAIETALGGSIQNIVADTETTAKSLIDYLKKNHLGRATFLPLNGIKVRASTIKESVWAEPGVIGAASDLVETEQEYQIIAEHLLGRIVVVDTIDHGLLLARKYQYTLRIVTLEGELLSPGGSMTGGSFKNTSNLLSRRREMEELKKQTEQISLNITTLQTEIEESRVREKAQEEFLEQLKKELQELYIQKSTQELNLTHAKEEKILLAEEYLSIQKENQEIEQQVSEIRTSMKECQDQIETYDQEYSSLEEEIKDSYLKTEQYQEEEETSNKELSEIRMKHSSYQQKLEFILENQNRIQSEINELLQEEAHIKELITNSHMDVQKREEQISQIHIKMEEAGNKRDELKQQLLVLTQEREVLSEKQKSSFTQREELSERMGLLDKELFRLHGQEEKLDEALLTGVNYMWDEYELTLSEAMALKEDSKLCDLSQQEPKAVKQRAGELRSAIKGLGAVNVNAIDDYKEVSERYEFLKSQHDDLITAEETLIQIIDELDLGMRVQFEEKFLEIKEEFDKVFQELFGGGKGTIDLVEDEDILEAGIRIISQPPGKKLQNMMQLSGGEKALTAIALLFAIQNLKPSPFCLLDEIEAALDDSNVGRYALYLHKLTAHTQFIVITHRRGTMMAADRLYGITMQEKGVSALVSVDLIEKESLS